MLPLPVKGFSEVAASTAAALLVVFEPPGLAHLRTALPFVSSSSLFLKCVFVCRAEAVYFSHFQQENGAVAGMEALQRAVRGYMKAFGAYSC